MSAGMQAGSVAWAGVCTKVNSVPSALGSERSLRAPTQAREVGHPRRRVNYHQTFSTVQNTVNPLNRRYKPGSRCAVPVKTKTGWTPC